MTDELKSIAERYERRKNIPADRYSRLNPAVNAIVQERQRALLNILAQQNIRDLSDLDIIEVGCGSGANLLELVQLGASPKRLVANELLPDRVATARRTLPADVKVFPGDATALSFGDGVFDIVYQSTVFSSILDTSLQRGLAAAMWRWVRPGGGVLWYDFTIDNPRNPDVRGVSVARLHELFPEGNMFLHRITLAPPLARAAVKLNPSLYGLLNILPFLRTHILCYIKKS